MLLKVGLQQIGLLSAFKKIFLDYEIFPGLDSNPGHENEKMQKIQCSKNLQVLLTLCSHRVGLRGRNNMRKSKVLCYTVNVVWQHNENAWF